LKPDKACFDEAQRGALFMNKTAYPLESLFGQILSPFERFLRRTTAGGIILMGTTVFTLILANSPWGQAAHQLWEQPARIGFGTWQLETSLHHLVNDGLMAVFFLVVGLELKREILVGELSSLRDAALPVVAALGGMIVPAGIYHGFNPSGPMAQGWGIPMATDIAFAVGILVLLAWRIPRNLIIFLTALAIADDLGAVLVIALFYSQGIHFPALGSSAAVLACLILLNRGGIRHALPYGLLGVLLWFSLLKSGIHATIAGVLLAFTIPARPAFHPLEFDLRLMQLQRSFHTEAVDSCIPPGVTDGNEPMAEGPPAAANDSCTRDQPLSNPRMATIADSLEKAAKAVQSPLQRMEHILSPWVTFVIIPIFALNNAGIDLAALHLGEALSHPVTLGVIFGLVLGKFLGIGGFSWLAVIIGLGKLPKGVRWRHLFGVAWLGGIGFTMSLFISQLAFTNPTLVEEAKLGILAASAISAVVGLIWLYSSAASPDSR
jgi:Na+:H+ antiporter, NhaA family